MQLTCDSIDERWSDVFVGNSIHLDQVEFIDSWSLGVVCLKAIERMNETDKNLILPKNFEVLSYLKRMHFDALMSELSYKNFMGELSSLNHQEHETSNLHEILHCEFADDLSARLTSKIRNMFRHFGLNTSEEQRATAIVGELGNNVFDHNSGSWPSKIRGAIIIGQRYPKLNSIHVIVADPGIGFLRSLQAVDPKPTNDIDAIRMGLRGITGRVGERRGNGLITVQNWTINNFSGALRIHSGSGLVTVDKSGISAKKVFPILGTIAEFTVKQG